jgi:hypothetical protein
LSGIIGDPIVLSTSADEALECAGGDWIARHHAAEICSAERARPRTRSFRPILPTTRWSSCARQKRDADLKQILSRRSE